MSRTQSNIFFVNHFDFDRDLLPLMKAIKPWLTELPHAEACAFWWSELLYW